MSKIGQVNLELQEQANELGYSTVQEAVDDGYEVVYSVDRTKLEAVDLEEEHKKAHKEWELKRAKVLGALEALSEYSDSKTIQKIAKDAIDFIEEGEV